MNRTRSALLVAAGAAATLFATTATAHAACTSASPTSTVWYDDAFDADPGAPEIGTARLSVEATCGVVVDPGIARPLTEDDAVLVYIDGDANVATGDPELGGADTVVATIGTDEPVRGVWDGDGYVFDDAPIGPAVGNGGFRSTVDALPLTFGIDARFVIVALTDVGDEIRGDHAGPIGLSVHRPAQAPVLTTPVSPYVPRRTLQRPVRPPRVVAPAPAPKPKPVPCTVPKTKGLTAAKARTRLKAAGCSVAVETKRAYSPTVRKGRVVGTTVPAGRSSASAFRLILSRGKR